MNSRQDAVKKMEACPECGATLREGTTCQDDFYQMLAWETESPALGEVHHLMVLSYHLQHPSLYSPDGLNMGKNLLIDFVERGASPQDVRRRNREVVDSGKRKWKITGTPSSHGAYDRPVEWNMTATDVVVGGMSSYTRNVKAWAQSTLESLRGSGNL